MRLGEREEAWGYNADASPATMPNSNLSARQIGWFRRLRRLGDPALTVLVVLQILVLFVDMPLMEMGVLGPLSCIPLELLTLGAALIVVSWKPVAVMALLVSFVAGFGAAGLHGVLVSRPTTVIDFMAKIIFAGVLTWVVGIQVFSAGRVTSHRIWGAVAIYLQLAMLFALSYLMIESHITTRSILC